MRKSRLCRGPDVRRAAADRVLISITINSETINMAYVETSTITATAGAAIGKNLRVKRSGANVVVATAADTAIGVTMRQSFASGDRIAIKTATAGGTLPMVAGGAINTGVEVFAAAGGKIAASGTVSIGTALEAASGDGHVIQVAVNE